MPASSGDVIGEALQSAYRHSSSSHPSTPVKQALQDQLSVCGKQVLTNQVEYEHAGRQQGLILDQLKTKYVTLTSNTTSSAPHPPSTPPAGTMAQVTPRQCQGGKEDQLDEPQVVLWPRDKVTLGWRKTFPPGAGMVNLGNTCYLNSSLQALFHIPALANWLLEELQSHTQRCEANTANASFCSVCAMMRTLRATLDRSTPVIKPALIQHKLKSIGKTLMYGRQEDAHEFIKLLLDHMEKSYLSFRRATKLDHRSKETTPLNQIFGGYLRQQVICPLCRYVSTTFSHFQDLVLDIRSVSSVDDALNLHFRKETLDSENAYRCERCHKKVPATKRHLIERAPHVLLIQLKRFTMSGGKIGKHINIQRNIDITRFVSGSGGGGVKQGGGGGGGAGGGGPYQYRLTSMVIHLGGSQHGGHYTAVAEASTGNMFEFDDSSVRSISLQSALLRNPYILFYEMVRRPKELSAVKQVVRQSSEKVLIRQNSDGVAAKPLPTSHSASSVINGFQHPLVDGGVGGGGGKGHLPPPLPCHKERERLSFPLKTQTKALAMDGAACKPSKIILHSGTSLLGSKNTPPTSSTSSLKSSLSSSTSSSSSSKAGVISSKLSSSSSSSSSTASSTSSSSKLALSSSSSSSTSSKLVLSSSSSSSTTSSTNCHKSSVPAAKTTSSTSGTKTVPHSTTSTSKASTSTTTTKGTVPPLVPYPDDSEDSEVDECRRGSKDKPSARMNGVKSAKGERPAGTSQRLTNGDVREGEGGAKGRVMVPRALQVVPGSARVKVESGWQVTDAALHSPSECSGGSGSGGPRAFTVVDQPPSTSRPDPDNQGWTVTVVEQQKQQQKQGEQRQQRQRPELEKSLSHDSVLPVQRGGEGAREGDSASLRSKASVDSGRSDRSTKSMKRSLFSLFTCVSSARSPDSPPAPPPHRATPTPMSDLTTTTTPTTTTTTTTASTTATTTTSTATTTTSSTTSDASQAKRGREQEEVEPSSPSKKACQDSQSASRTVSKQDQSPGRKTREDQSPCRTGKQGCHKDQSPARSSTTTTATTNATTTTATSTATTTTSATVAKNGLPSTASRRPKNCQPNDVPKNLPAKTKNESARSASDTNHHHHHHNGTTKDSSSTSTSSLSSSSDSDSEEEEEEEEEGEDAGRWVEKTKETMGSARLHPAPSVIHWNGTTHHKGKKTGLWDGSRSSSVVDELRRAGNMAYGAEVSAWSGGRSLADQEMDQTRREAKKRSAVDVYNEEMDSGRSKKLKGPKKGGWGGSSQAPSHTQWNNNNNSNNNNNNNNNNPFQRLQDSRFNNNNSSSGGSNNNGKTWTSNNHNNNTNTNDNDNNNNNSSSNSNNNNNNSNSHHRGSPAHHYHHHHNNNNNNSNNPHHHHYNNHHHNHHHRYSGPYHNNRHPQYWDKGNRSWQRNRRPKFHHKKYRDKYKHGW